MTDKKKIRWEPVDINSHAQYEAETAAEAPAVIDPEPEPPFNPYYEKRDWMNGVRQIYRCTKCGTDRDEEDAIIEHILLHYSKEQQEEMLNELLAIQARNKEQ